MYEGLLKSLLFLSKSCEKEDSFQQHVKRLALHKASRRKGPGSGPDEEQEALWRAGEQKHPGVPFTGLLPSTLKSPGLLASQLAPSLNWKPEKHNGSIRKEEVIPTLETSFEGQFGFTSAEWRTSCSVSQKGL